MEHLGGDDEATGERAEALAAAVLTVTTVASSAPAPEPAADEAALTPVRQAPSAGVERKVDALLARMTTAEKLQQVQLLLHGTITRRRRQGGCRRCLQPHRPGEDRPLPARRGRAVPPAHPDPVRLRHHPRIPHDLPRAARVCQTCRPVGRPRLQPGGRPGSRPWSASKQVYAPMVDVSHEPRWGRIVEGNGEDPYLGSALAAASVKGSQGNDYSARDRVVASPSTTWPTASPRAGATTTPPTSPSSGCATCTCRRSGRRSTPVPTP